MVVGVPDMIRVTLSNESPEGSVGVIEYVRLPVPPVAWGSVREVIWVSLVYDWSDTVWVPKVGRVSCMAISNGTHSTPSFLNHL